MREKIIFAPGARENEIIRNLALHGVTCINMKIMGANALAKYALMKSGISISEEFISSKEECAIIASAITGIDFYGKTTYSDIIHIASAIKMMRSLVDSENEEQVLTETFEKGIKDKVPGIFAVKDRALLETYRNYVRLLEGKNAIDSVALIRRAIADSKVIDADFVCLEEYPVNPLEKALLNKVSNKNYTVAKLSDIYNLGEANIRISEYKNCYGAPNEVEMILSDIYSGKQMDECTVAITDASEYSQLFFDYALLYNLPITFGCGVPIINSNPARLLVLYYRWITGGFFGKQAISNILNSAAFNKLAWRSRFGDVPEGFSWKIFNDVLTNLRLTNNKDINRRRLEDYKKAISEEEAIISEDSKDYENLVKRKMCIPCLEIAAEELCLAPEEFIAKYSYIRTRSESNSDILLMKVDMAAVSAIFDELGVIRQAGAEQSTDDLIKNVLKLGVCSESSEAGKLHITGIDGAMSTIRENLYIAGMSATKFPGSPKENYLLLDSDIRLFGEAAEYLTSEGRIKKNTKRLMDVVQLASSLGSNIYISYAGLNVSELKHENASSMIYELFSKEHGKNISTKELEEYIKKVEYFEPAISVGREIGKQYNKGNIITVDKVEKGKACKNSECEVDKCEVDDCEVKVDISHRSWSPSAIGKYLENEREFMLQYLFGIPEPEVSDPFEIIAPDESGTLVHSLMEQLANSDMSKEDFLKLSGEYFDRFIMENPPLIRINVANAKTDFLDMMETAYNSDSHREVVLKEEDIESLHPSGVLIHGYPDRVEKLDDGSYIVVDYKSGRTVKHIQDDIYTCLQVVIYAYLMEQKGFRISGCEYRYIRSGEVVTCKYDGQMKEELNRILVDFKEYVENFKFVGLMDSGNSSSES